MTFTPQSLVYVYYHDTSRSKQRVGRLLLKNRQIFFELMALEAGLNVAKANMFPSRKGLGFFGVQRFDRNNTQTVHMHTIAGLLHADHREPCLDYESIMKATLYLTRDVRQCEVQFRNAVFNVLGHNRDDHSKNFSFLIYDQQTSERNPF